MRHLTVMIFVFLVACKDKSGKIIATNSKSKITFSDNFIICDTCQMTILVHHDECTTCGEITIDSGTVYLTNKILKNIDTLAINSDKLDSFDLSPNYVPIHELYFEDKKYFNKLWTDTINFKDFYKSFRLTGKVVEIKRKVLDNGVIEIYPSLYFKVDKAVEVNSSYLRKITAN